MPLLRLFLRLVPLLWACALAGCPRPPAQPVDERVTCIRLDPAEPQPGALVQVHIDYSSNLEVSTEAGEGPTVFYGVDAGELKPEQPPTLFPSESASPRQCVLLASRTVFWQLPASGRATLSAAMATGGQTISVVLDPPVQSTPATH